MESPSAARTDATLIDANTLRAVTASILRTAGLDVQAASRAADALIAADLRGVESHGVSNMLREYVGWLEHGHVNPDPQLTIVRETPATG